MLRNPTNAGFVALGPGVPQYTMRSTKNDKGSIVVTCKKFVVVRNVW